MILVLLLAQFTTQAQFLENNNIYVSGGFGISEYNGANLKLNYYLKDKFSFSYVHRLGSRRAVQRPHDYSSGLIPTLLTFGLSERVRDRLASRQFLLGFGKNIKGGDRCRFLLKAGPTFNTYSYAVNFGKVEEGSFLGPNYVFSRQITSNIGVAVSAELEICNKFSGLSISPNAHINREGSYIGFDFNILVGPMCRKKLSSEF